MTDLLDRADVAERRTTVCGEVAPLVDRHLECLRDAGHQSVGLRHLVYVPGRGDYEWATEDNIQLTLPLGATS